MYRKNHSRAEVPLRIKDENGRTIKNPNQITVNQHVLPQAHLAEWANGGTLLNVFDKQKQCWMTPDLENAFTVVRLWDQWTESTFLGTNERNYQIQASRVKQGLDIDKHGHLLEYYLMLGVRAEVVAKERPSYDPVMNLTSEPANQAELENIELANVGENVHFALPGDADSQALAREVVKMFMNITFMQRREAAERMEWIPFTMTEVDAIFPDSNIKLYQRGLAIIPMTPKIVLIGKSTLQRIDRAGQLTPNFINAQLLDSSVRYYVASSKIPIQSAPVEVQAPMP